MIEVDVIVFVVLGKEGVIDVDEYVLCIFYKINKLVILVVNKVDNFEMCNDIYDFYFFGLGDFYFLLLVYGIGIGDILDVIVENFLVEEENENLDIICFSLIGCLNVGKFSLINVIFGEDCVIVSLVVGIMCDVIDINFVDS